LSAPARERRQLLCLPSARKGGGELRHARTEPSRVRKNPRVQRGRCEGRLRAHLQSAGLPGVCQHAEARSKRPFDHRTDQGSRCLRHVAGQSCEQIVGGRGSDVRMRALAGLIISAIASVLVGGSALAAELVMFEDPACPYCRRWHAEVGVSYHATAEGRIAPLRRVDIKDRYKAGVSLKGPVTFTPTFVLAE